MRAWHRFRSLGPGLLITAAFIGPGTVTTASVAGAGFGYALLWALLFSVLATVVLQEMSARLGLVSRAGLGEALHRTFRHSPIGPLCKLLVIAAIAFGNAAFQVGNVTGAALALESLTNVERAWWTIVVGGAAAALLASAAYRWIERVLGVLVAVMGLVFLTTAVAVRPDFVGIVSGAFVPSLPSGALLTVLALIGTTVVPYNLFLHASAVREKWPTTVPIDRALRECRMDALVSIGLGGVVTLSIVVTAAAFFERGSAIDSAATMAAQLEPVLGRAARAFFGIGLFAAGLTSAVTAPLAAAYATAGVLGWAADLRAARFRAIWLAIIAAGTILALLGRNPVAAILFAQAANGLLLPVLAVALLVVVNRSELLGRHRNRRLANALGGAVVAAVSGLGILRLLEVLGALG